MVGDKPSQLQRLAGAPIYGHRDELALIGRDGALRRFSGDSAALVSALLDYLHAPHTQDEVIAHVAALTGAEPAALSIVDEALATLKQAGVIEALAAPPMAASSGAAPSGAASPEAAPFGAVSSAPHDPLRDSKLALALCGGVVASLAPALIELLQGRGCQVRVAATDNALRFVSTLSIEAYTHQPVIRALWPTAPHTPVPHLELASWADAAVVYPATATTLSRIACGDCSNVVSALAISAKVPVLLVPAMNEAMYTAPAVQRNLAQLRDDGFYVAHPTRGYEVACSPEQRNAAVIGAAPPLGAIVDMLATLLPAKP